MSRASKILKTIIELTAKLDYKIAVVLKSISFGLAEEGFFTETEMPQSSPDELE